MSTNPHTPEPTPLTPKRAYRAAGPLPPPPRGAGVEVMNRREAAEFMGVSFKTFGTWETEGRVTIQRYRATSGTGRAIFYVAADLARLREEFGKIDEPYPDPQRPGVYRVPVRSYKQRMEALIDAEDLPKVRGKNWNWHKRSGSEEIEVVLSVARQRQTPLKRLILGLDGPECKERVVCFVNGDPLDCRRANLVVKTLSEANLGKAKLAMRAGRPPSSRYKGVDWDATRRLWRAQIGMRETHRMLGRFRDEAQAAAVYDAAAREMFGALAVLNFPDGVVPAPTFLSPDGQPVREKNAYRVARGLPTPPPGEAMLTREEAALALDVSTGSLGVWEREGAVSVPRYRVKDTTGTPILYAAADIARLRAELDKVGQPYPDPHPARAGVWRVPLRTLSGYIEALIDEADLPIVQGKKWNFVTHEGSGLDRGAVIQVGARDTPKTPLKRLIMGQQGDGHAARITHVNGNPLDCRRDNLVITTPDKVTRRVYKILHRSGRPTSSRFKGVYWSEREGKWQAQIRVDDRTRRLGLFDDEEDAAFAYDEAAREVWGEEARVNFPRPGELPSAAAPVSPADLWPDAPGPAARPPGKPTDFAAVLNDDGSVTLSWRSANAAASSGVTFAVSRKLPGQGEFTRIGTARGTTTQTRRPCFTDATIPAADLSMGAEAAGAEYIVQGARGTTLGEPSDILNVRLSADGTALIPPAPAQAA